MVKPHELVVDLFAVSQNDSQSVGAKAANLGELFTSGFPIPAGFVITAEAFYEFIRKNSLLSKIQHLLPLTNFENDDSIIQTSKKIRKLINTATIPAEITEEVFTRYEKLGSGSFVTIRYSGTNQNQDIVTELEKKYLGIQGESDILFKLRDAWSNLFVPELVKYRGKNNLEEVDLKTSLIIQKMVEPEVSGRILSNNLNTDNSSVFVVEALYGFPGDNKTMPDHYTVDRDSFKILTKSVSLQGSTITKAANGYKKLSLPETIQKKQKLTDVEILGLARLSEKIEKHFLLPMQIYWAKEKEKMFILDVLPMSTDLVPDEIQTKSTDKNPHLSFKTATALYVNCMDYKTALKEAPQNVDGAGIYGNSFILETGIHPKEMIKRGNVQEYINHLANSLISVCQSFNPRKVTYELSSLSSDDYKKLAGGTHIEAAERNPSIGFRGAFRYIHDPDIIKLELSAIKRVCESGISNLSITIPFIRTLTELKEVKKIIFQSGFLQKGIIKFFINTQIPANIGQIEQMISEGVDGVNIPLSDLAMFMTASDKDNPELTSEFDLLNNSVLWAVEKIIDSCKKWAVPVCVTIEPHLHTEFISSLVLRGVNIISVLPESVNSAKLAIYKTEADIINTSHVKN